MRIFRFNGDPLDFPVIILIEDREDAELLHRTVFENGIPESGMLIGGIEGTTEEEAIDAAFLVFERWGNPDHVIKGIRKTGDDHMRPV